ncbi:MAG: hypothetical protein AAF430_01495 [Myxococcota bacterium]
MNNDNIVSFSEASDDGTPPPFGQVVLAIEEWDPELERDHEAFVAAAVLLSTMYVGTDVTKLAAYTGYPKDQVAELARRFRRNKIWLSEGAFRAPWITEEDEWVAKFWMYVNVGTGQFRVVDESEDGELLFEMTPKGIRHAEKLVSAT